MRLAYESQRESAADTIRRRAIRIRHVSSDTGSASDVLIDDDLEDDEFDEDPPGGKFDVLDEGIG